MYKLGAIGMGNMGLCILDGAVKCGAVKPQEIIIFDLAPEKIETAKKRGFAIAGNEEQVYNESQFILFAVIPQVYEAVLEKFKSQKQRSEQVIISIAAGISAKFIQSYLGANKKVVNVMPNTPLMIGIGATALAKTDSVTDAEFSEICGIFKAMGEVAVMKEEQLAEIIPANGSTPAYVYYFMDCIARSIEKRGIDKQLALKLIAKSFIGSAEMVLQTGLSPKELIDQVCSPGGLTIETINVFDKRDLFSIIDEGCNACVNRGYELAK